MMGQFALREHFIFRHYYYEALALMEPEMRLKAYDAIMEYVFHGETDEDREEENPVEIRPFLTMAFVRIREDFENQNHG